jgi:hypothetical protein
MTEHFTFSTLPYGPLLFLAGSVLFILDTNWPRPNGVNPSVETIFNWHTVARARDETVQVSRTRKRNIERSLGA